MITTSGVQIRTALTGSTALITLLGGTAIYQLAVPQGTVPPYVIYQRLAGEELNESPTRSREEIWMVVGIATRLDVAGSLDAACYAAVDGATLSVEGWVVYGCERESDISYAEPEEGGEVYYHEGGLYRVRMADP